MDRLTKLRYGICVAALVAIVPARVAIGQDGGYPN